MGARLLTKKRITTELSLRERQVLQLIAEGFTSAAVGERLLISEETVKSHIGRILEKTGARSRAHAVAIGMRRRDIV